MNDKNENHKHQIVYGFLINPFMLLASLPFCNSDFLVSVITIDRKILLLFI